MNWAVALGSAVVMVYLAFRIGYVYGRAYERAAQKGLVKK